MILERNTFEAEIKRLLYEIAEYDVLPDPPKRGWWSANRLLKKDSKGPEVLKLQKVLKNNWGITVNLTSRFDQATVEAIKKFQADSDLESDGMAGPFTQAMLFENNYAWRLPKPAKVQQILARCWAACYQSALPTWKGRPSKTVTELVGEFRQFTDNSGAITVRGLEETARKFKVEKLEFDPIFFRVETVKKILLEKQTPIILVHGLNDDIGHAEVVFGFGVKDGGKPHLSVMDPFVGDYKDLRVSDLQDRGKRIMLLSPI